MKVGDLVFRPSCSSECEEFGIVMHIPSKGLLNTVDVLFSSETIRSVWTYELEVVNEN